MAWLRIDDGFAQHPKIVKLARVDRWTWLEVLCYCARYKTRGIVPAAVGEVVRGASPAYLNRCFELHLLDRNGDDYIVHDWDDYNGRDPKILQTERQRKHRDTGVTDGVTIAVQERDENVTHVRARGRVPVPNPTEVANATSGERAPDELWDALVAELGEAVTKTEHGQRNGAIKEFRDVGATAADVHARCRAYRRKWPEMTLTAAALKKHWSSLEPAKVATPAPVGEVLNFFDIDTAANLEHIREMAGSIGREVA